MVLLHLVFNVEDGCEELEREIEEGVAEGGGGRFTVCVPQKKVKVIKEWINLGDLACV